MKKLLSIAAITLFVVGLTGCKSMKSGCCGSCGGEEAAKAECCGTDGSCCKEGDHKHE
jgi:hypothetical protein